MEEPIGKSKVVDSVFSVHQKHWVLFKMWILGLRLSSSYYRLQVRLWSLHCQQIAPRSLMLLFSQLHFRNSLQLKIASVK